MKIYVKGKNTAGGIELTNNCYISSGGEGTVYAKKGWAYKVYTDSSKALPEAKLKELSILKADNIIKPEYIILDKNNSNIGYAMKHVPKAVALCQLFTRSFKDRNKIEHDGVLDLVNEIRDGIQHCHDNRILIVDVNELNFLVKDTTFDKVYFIDVDSYQTKTYKATAIMDSIRDRHAKTWNKETDWFSFGIIAFQLFVGIHPYKGKHKTYNGIDARMQNNISVFNKDVRVPGAALSLDIIPNIYREWFKYIFEDGNRVAPPFGDVDVVTISVQTKVIEGTDNFIIEMIKELDATIVEYINDSTVLTTDGLYVDGKGIDKKIASYAEVIINPRDSYIITAIIKDSSLRMYNASSKNEIASIDVHVDYIMKYDNKFYINSNETIHEIEFVDVRDDVAIFGLTPICNVLPGATQIFPGVVIQDLLGIYYVSVLPKSKTHKQIRINELSGYRILDAKYENRVLIILAENTKTKKYDNIIIKFDKDINTYSVRISDDVNYSNVNFTVLDNGVCAFMNGDNYIELFFNNKDKHDVKLIKDNSLAGGRLYSNGNTVLLAEDNKLYAVKMK